MCDPLPGPRPSRTHQAAASCPSVSVPGKHLVLGPGSLPLPTLPRNLGVVSDFSTQGGRGQNPKQGHSGAGHPVCRTWLLREHSGGIICHYCHLGVHTVPRVGLTCRSPEGGAECGPFLSPPGHGASKRSVDPSQGASLKRTSLQRFLGVQRPLGSPVPSSPSHLQSPPNRVWGAVGKGSRYQTQDGSLAKSLMKTPETPTARRLRGAFPGERLQGSSSLPSRSAPDFGGYLAT